MTMGSRAWLVIKQIMQMIVKKRAVVNKLYRNADPCVRLTVVEDVTGSWQDLLRKAPLMGGVE